MRSTKALMVLFAAATSLVSAQYLDAAELYSRDLHADEMMHVARSAVGEAAAAHIEAREQFDLMRRFGGNGECKKGSNKIHCMKGSRSCSTKGCREVGVGCVCDFNFMD